MSSVDDDLTPRPALDGDLDVDVAIVGAGYTGLWTAYYLTAGRPVAAGRRPRGGDRRVRRVGPQRRLVLGPVPAVADRRWPAGTAATAAVGAAPRDGGHRGRGRPGRRRRGHRLPLRQGRHRRPGPQSGPEGPRPGRGRCRPAVGLDLEWLDAAAGARRVWRATGVLGATYTPALRRDPSGPAGARAGPGRRAARASRIFERTRVTAIAAPAVPRPATRTRTARCGPTSWCGRPRAYTPQLPGCTGGRSCRCTR